MNAAIFGTGEIIRLDGVVAFKDLDFEAGGKEFSVISSSLNIVDFELSNFSQYRLESLSFRLLSLEKLVIELKGTAEGNLNEGTFRTDITEFSTDENLIALLPEEQRKSFPLSSFAIKGNLSALHKSAKDDFSFSGTVSTSKIKFASPIADLQPENSIETITFSCTADKESVKKLNADLLVSDFKYKNAVIGLKLGSSVEKISFKENSLDMKSIEGSVTLASGGRVDLKCGRPFSLKLAATPLEIKPSLVLQLEIIDMPLENMHCFFDPLEGYKAEGGTGNASIFCEFRDGFNLNTAKTDVKINNFSFSSCGHSFRKLNADIRSEAAFDGWTKLNVNSCETTIYSQEVPIAKLTDSAKFDFTASTGTICTKAILLDEKLVALLPKDLADSFGFIRKISLNSSENSFSYDKNNLYTSGKIIATGFLPDNRKIPESDFKLSYDIRTKDAGYEFRNCMMENFIGNAKAMDLGLSGYCDPSIKKYNLKIKSEQADIEMISESLIKDKSQTGEDKSQRRKEESAKNETKTSFLSEEYDIDAQLSLKNISYGKLLKGNLDGSIGIKKGFLNVQNICGNINEAPIAGGLAADLRDSSSIRYNAKLKVGKLKMEPVITPFVVTKHPFKGILEGLEFNAESQSVTIENPVAKITGALKASFSNLSIPTTLKEKSLMANFILTPIETIASIGKYLPIKYIPSELSSAASVFTDYFQNFDNVAFDAGEIAATAKDGIITIGKCDFKGTAVKELTLRGTIRGSDGTMDTRARTKIGKLIVPLRIKGIFSSPSTEYTMILPDFIEANAGNLLDIKNIGDLLKITGEKGKDSSTDKEKIDVEGILNLFKKKKTENKD